MEKKYYSVMFFRCVLRTGVRGRRMQDYQNLLVKARGRLYNYKFL